MPFVPTGLLRKLFEEATKQVLNRVWTDLYRKEILPCPDLSTLPQLPSFGYATGMTMPSSTLREQRLTWTMWSMEFINRNKQVVDQKKRDMERHLNDELAAWNRNHPEKNEQLSPEKMYKEWFASIENLSLIDFTRLYIWAGTARQFLEPKFEELKYRYGMNLTPAPKLEKGQIAVFINNDARAKLIDALTPYVDEVDWKDLSGLINNKSTHVLITANCQQNTLGKVFYQAYTSGCTQSTKTAFAKWICQHFQRKTDDQIYKLTQSTILNHLKGKDLNKT
ncbi:hypothetical protein [Spirosoma aerophilum]